MKNIILYFIFFIPLNLLSQNSAESNKKILVRGKIIASAILEDTYFRNLSIGMEFRLLNQHSIGIDYVHFRFRTEKDSTVNGKEYLTGPSVYSKRNYVNIDYRYYPFPNRLKGIIDPYLNSFVKIGKRAVWSADSSLVFSHWDERLYVQNSNFTDYGLAAGMRLDFGTKDRFGLDVNIGAVKRISDILYQKYETENPLTVHEEYNTSDSKWLIHMRLNLYFRIGR